MKTRHVLGIASLAGLLSLPLALADDGIATLRDGTPISEQPDAPTMPRVVNDDLRQKRNYPMQPPLIPHEIRGYEVNLKVNRCMACHARRRTDESQAPMISVTHYMDREGNFLAEISPRRYFCNQCHVNQTETRELVGNDFVDMDALLEERAAAQDE